MAPAPSLAMRRRNAIQTSRGAVLAAHSAAGVAMGVSKEAERLLRTAEGLIRSAVGFLELARREAPEQLPPQAGGAPGAAGGAPGAEGGTKPHKKKKKKKQRKKHATDCMDDDGCGAALDASGEPCLADEWADGIPAVGPCLPRATETAAGATGTSTSSARVLKPHASRERSPPPRALHKPHLGGCYTLQGLTSQPSLNGTDVVITDHSEARDRWAARLGTGKVLWVKAEALAAAPTSWMASRAW